MTDEAATKLGEESADKTSVKGWPVFCLDILYLTDRSILNFISPFFFVLHNHTNTHIVYLQFWPPKPQGKGKVDIYLLISA